MGQLVIEGQFPDFFFGFLALRNIVKKGSG
jgi:hypothetical protein